MRRLARLTGAAFVCMVAGAALAQEPGATPAAPAPTAPAAPAARAADPTELAFWNSVRESRSAEELRAYLQAYPNGVFAPLARVRID